jgi:hypothetical protein
MLLLLTFLLSLDVDGPALVEVAAVVATFCAELLALINLLYNKSLLELNDKVSLGK